LKGGTPVLKGRHQFVTTRRSRFLEGQFRGNVRNVTLGQPDICKGRRGDVKKIATRARRTGQGKAKCGERSSMETGIARSKAREQTTFVERTRGTVC